MRNATADRRNGRASAVVAERLERVTFKTSRAMDSFSERELVTQTGHGRDEWPLVIIKELLDNALDACEEADTPPVVGVAADAGGISGWRGRKSRRVSGSCRCGVTPATPTRAV